MGAIIPSTMRSQTSEDEARHRMEAELILLAIAAAIAADTLPPDDACAWARIAAFEARHLRTVTVTGTSHP
jgi:hypothetical protein